MEEKRRIFEIDTGEKFWIVASNEDQIAEYIKENDFEADDFTVREITRDKHFPVALEDAPGTMDVWTMVDIDLQEGLEIPYMIASTVY